MEQNPIIAQLADHSGLTAGQVRACLAALVALVAEHEPIADATEENELERWWICFAHAVKNELVVEDEHYRMDSDHLYLRWRKCHEAYLQVHRPFYGRQGHGAAILLRRLTADKAYAGTNPSLWIGKNRSSAIVFRVADLPEFVFPHPL